MSKKYSIGKNKAKDILALLLLMVAALCLVASVSVDTYSGDAWATSQKVSKIVSKRMEMLEGYMQRAMEEDHAKWLDLGNLPEDMVIYRYESDTLQSWSNQFSVANDDISLRIAFQRISNLKSSIISPLTEVTSEVSYVNYGPKWYLVKSLEKDDCNIIGGLEVLNSLDDRSFNGANPKFHISDKFSIQPISYSDGYAVMLGQQPVFKIVSDSVVSPVLASNTLFVTLALFFFIFAGILYLRNKRTIKRFALVLVAFILATLGMYDHGIAVQNEVPLFSPTVYANGGVFRSLGSVVIVNMFIILFTICCYLMRRNIYRWVLEKNTLSRRVLNNTLILLSMVGICAYSYLTFKSIIMNSSITLEIYKLNELSIYTAVVYLSEIILLMAIPLMMCLLVPGKGMHINPLSRKGRLVFSACVAILLLLTSSLLGFRKEEDRVDVWMNRLSMDRDVALEIQLFSAEADIATDPVISSLSFLAGSEGIITNRITETHLFRASQDNNISVLVVDQSQNNNPAVIGLFNERIRGGTPVADGSRFHYTRDSYGQAVYTGMFVYYNADFGVTRLFVELEPKTSKNGRGYSNILGYTSSGRIVIPSKYSYAKYVGGNLVNYNGTVPYPTVLSENIVGLLEEDDDTEHYILDGYSHIIKEISEDEYIIMSRPVLSKSNYGIAAFFIGLFTYLLSHVLNVGLRRRRTAKKENINYYKSRINIALMVSLVITLITLSGISILFVYKRNNESSHTMMSNRVTSIQALLQERCRYARDISDLNTQEMSTILENIGNSTDSDITLYTTGGRAFKTTNMEVFDRMLISTRMDERAYENIVYNNSRYYINREKSGRHRYHALYAPIINQAGKMIAIMSTPYSDESYDFETDAIMHMVTILTIFIILLLLARVSVLTVVDKMFKPLIDMSKTMNSANIDNLQYIFYERKDEIAPLVRAYNLMVHDLSNSTKQLAQAERDKAWSQMARQVAHEIKNPLTPMKLQLERIIRLKNNNNPIWADRFDEASQIMLEQINILTDTANEFSTFAKLYWEEPADIEVDKLLHEQVYMFNNKEFITMSYIGLDGAMIKGPKPQLTRVFVNLITNAVQAIENARADTGLPEEGKIVVSLRNSIKEGFYDIVVEDNGPGVKDEDRSKLFVPNFTTKTGGSGLGLAISRNIIDKCGGEILYSKSFTLQGACFTVRYPKPKQVDALYRINE